MKIRYLMPLAVLLFMGQSLSGAEGPMIELFRGEGIASEGDRPVGTVSLAGRGRGLSELRKDAFRLAPGGSRNVREFAGTHRFYAQVVTPGVGAIKRAVQMGAAETRMAVQFDQQIAAAAERIRTAEGRRDDAQEAAREDDTPETRRALQAEETRVQQAEDAHASLLQQRDDLRRYGAQVAMQLQPLRQKIQAQLEKFRKYETQAREGLAGRAKMAEAASTKINELQEQLRRVEEEAGATRMAAAAEIPARAIWSEVKTEDDVQRVRNAFLQNQNIRLYVVEKTTVPVTPEMAAAADSIKAHLKNIEAFVGRLARTGSNVEVDFALMREFKAIERRLNQLDTPLDQIMTPVGRAINDHDILTAAFPEV